jgi:hypothetical protein
MSCNADMTLRFEFDDHLLMQRRICPEFLKAWKTRRRPEPDIHPPPRSRNPQDPIERGNPGKAAMR